MARRCRFNPCFSGMAFGTQLGVPLPDDVQSFNPCFSGMAFGTCAVKKLQAGIPEFQSLFFWNGLWDPTSKAGAQVPPAVSILVFLEWPLGLRPGMSNGFRVLSFNPCFSGMAFGTERHGLKEVNRHGVSILVFLEWPLGPETT